MSEANSELTSSITQPTKSQWGQRLRQILHIGPKKNAPLFQVLSQPEPGKKPLIPLSKKAELQSGPLDEEVLKAVDH